MGENDVLKTAQAAHTEEMGQLQARLDASIPLPLDAAGYVWESYEENFVDPFGKRHGEHGDTAARQPPARALLPGTCRRQDPAPGDARGLPEQGGLVRQRRRLRGVQARGGCKGQAKARRPQAGRGGRRHAHPRRGPLGHAVWQGRVYSRSGRDPKYPSLDYGTGYHGTGPHAALGDRLCGVNCLHSLSPWQTQCARSSARGRSSTT